MDRIKRDKIIFYYSKIPTRLSKFHTFVKRSKHANLSGIHIFSDIISVDVFFLNKYY
jgi:hypothetical protein